MYALRLVYQRHRKLAPWVGAMVALFFVTLIATMPVPHVEAAAPSALPPSVPAVVKPLPAGQLAGLLSQERFEDAGESTLAFVPSADAF
ncbi:MAG TPA: hypothetical protein VG757_12600 [Devosia sp.]|nr:hypothetical protein [Devosia sp.]